MKRQTVSLSAEAELAQLLIATREVRQANAARTRDLAERVEFERLASLLHQQRLLPLVGTRLLALAPETVPDAFRERITQASTYQRGLSVLLEATSSRALNELSRVGVSAVPLKGPALAAAIYGDAGLRASGDVDLLVPGDDLERATLALTARGFLPPRDPLYGGRPLLHYRLQPQGFGAAIELHWRIHWYETRFADELIARSEEHPSGRQLDPVGGLAALLLFYVRDGMQGLRYPADVAAWWDRFGPGIEAGALSHLITAHPRLERAILAAAQAAGLLVGLPTKHLVAGGVRLDRRTVQAGRLATPTLDAEFDQLEADRVLVDCLVGPNGDAWGYVDRHILRPHLPPHWKKRLSHPFKLIVRHLNALIALRLGSHAPLPRSGEGPERRTAPRVLGERPGSISRGSGSQATMTPKSLPVSVIIPAYNRAHLLPRALESVRRQYPWSPDDVIVIDDGSSDGTAEVARSMGARVIRHPENRGLSAARNTGVREAKHPWVALLDSDDEWLPHHLAVLWQHRNDHVLVANSALWCGPIPEEDRLQGPTSNSPVVLRTPVPLVYPDNFLPVSAAMVSKRAVEEAGGFASRQGVVEDFDLWLRLLEHGTGLVSPTVGLLYHVHGDQMSQDHQVMHDAHLAALEACSASAWWSPSLAERFRGRSEWDKLRLAMRNGELVPTCDHARKILIHPQRLIGVGATWSRRFRMRRRTSRIARDGRPSLAILPGSARSLVHQNGGRPVVDLSGHRTFRSAWLQLVRRPTAEAVVTSQAQSFALRAIGVRPRPVIGPNLASSE